MKKLIALFGQLCKQNYESYLGIPYSDTQKKPSYTDFYFASEDYEQKVYDSFLSSKLRHYLKPSDFYMDETQLDIIQKHKNKNSTDTEITSYFNFYLKFIAFDPNVLNAFLKKLPKLKKYINPESLFAKDIHGNSPFYWLVVQKNYKLLSELLKTNKYILDYIDKYIEEMLYATNHDKSIIMHMVGDKKGLEVLQYISNHCTGLTEYLKKYPEFLFYKHASSNCNKPMFFYMSQNEIGLNIIIKLLSQIEIKDYILNNLNLFTEKYGDISGDISIEDNFKQNKNLANQIKTILRDRYHLINQNKLKVKQLTKNLEHSTNFMNKPQKIKAKVKAPKKRGGKNISSGSKAKDNDNDNDNDNDKDNTNSKVQKIPTVKRVLPPLINSNKGICKSNHSSEDSHPAEKDTIAQKRKRYCSNTIHTPLQNTANDYDLEERPTKKSKKSDMINKNISFHI